MADLTIDSLRGGLNEDSPVSLANDQCTVATNVEWVRSQLGERRKGSDGIDLTGSGITGASRVTWVYRHLPTTDQRDAQLWILALTAPSTVTLVYQDSTGWHTVSPTDAIDPDYVYQVTGQTLHGKLFIAYRSTGGVDRLHVWDGTSLRRTGLAEPAAPTVAETGVGTYSGIRYFRVRYAVLDGSTVLRRSEPSDSTSYDPASFGSNGASARITKPASISEGETHWEIEASLDNSTFYRLARQAVASTTYDDSVAFSSGYATATGAVLSETVTDYDLIPSARYLAAVDDRLMFAGSYEDESLASQVGWTPVGNDPGVGNDERMASSTDPTINLDNYDGGAVTGLSQKVNGYVFVTKDSHIWQGSKTGVRSGAYDFIALTKERGGIEGSLVTALDNGGNPTLFALDPDIGPIRFGPRGVEPCGLDLIETWSTVNLDATLVPSRGVFFRENKQVHWWVPTGASNIPDTRLVLHTNLMRETEDGMRRGWAIWTGPSAAALTACLFSTNVDDMSSGASKVLAPVIGVVGNGLVWLTDTGTDDNGTAYAASIQTKPFVLGNLMSQFECKSGTLHAKAAAGVTVDVTATIDFGLGTRDAESVSLTAEASEEWVTVDLDDLSIAEAKALQITFADSDTPTGRWQLERFAMRNERGTRL